MIIPAIEQSKRWNEEGVSYLRENEFEWVTVRITSDNEVHIYPDLCVDEVEKESEDDTILEEQGKIILMLADRVQFIVHEEE